MDTIKVIGYNPLNANNFERRVEIADETRSQDLVILVGTGQKQLEISKNTLLKDDSSMCTLDTLRNLAVTSHVGSVFFFINALRKSM